jgi:hypothetical protein
MEQTQKKSKFPTEVVTLPSKGLLYPEGHPLKSGTVEMKYMTAKEEDILTNQNYINKGIVIDKLLESLIVTPLDYNDLLIGDKNSMLVAARILGYGADYTFKRTNPSSGEEEQITVDLTDADDKLIDESLLAKGRNEFSFTLPTTNIPITFKLLTQKDEYQIERELKGLKKINKNNAPELTTRLKHVITSVNGDSELKTIREFVDETMLAKDARALREYSKKVMPDIDLNFDLEYEDGHIEENVKIPIGVNFFWPDASV